VGIIKREGASDAPEPQAPAPGAPPEPPAEQGSNPPQPAASGGPDDAPQAGNPDASADPADPADPPAKAPGDHALEDAVERGYLGNKVDPRPNSAHSLESGPDGVSALDGALDAKRGQTEDMEASNS
jgi:hypothetical protein